MESPEHSMPVDVDESFVPVRRPDIATVELDGETVCYDTSTGEVHVLNQTATLLWACFAVPGSITEVIDDLVAELHVERDGLRDDVLKTVRDMIESGLVEQASATPTVPHRPREDAPCEPRFLDEPPTL